jgi:hypothetical protein
MASVDKIIAERNQAGIPTPSEILAVRDTTPGVTDALYVNNVLDALGETNPWFTSQLERDKTAKVPTVKAILDKLGYTDDKGAKDGKGKYGWEKFVENFGKDMYGRPGREVGNKERILGTPELGERGWETVKKLWQQASYDKMMSDIAMGRQEALDEGVLGKVSGTAGKVFTPRVRNAWEEGRDARPSELFMDLFQNAAYMAPIGGVGSGITRVLGGSPVAKAAGAVLSNAIAPSAIVGGDYALGTKDYAGAGDAALDAGLGTATNLGMNRVLFPMASSLMSMGLARTQRMPWLAEFLEGMKSDKEKARDLIRAAETKVKKHFAETNSEYLRKRQEGRPVDRLSDTELKGYIDVLNARDLLGEKETVDRFASAMRELRASDAALDGYNPAEKVGSRRLDDIDDLYSAQKLKRSHESIIDGALGRVGYKTPEEVAAWDIAEFVGERGGHPVASAARALKAHPELVSQYDRPSMREVLAMPRTGVDVGKSWAVNRAGDDAAAQRVVGRFGIDPGDIREEQDRARTEKAAKRDIGRVLSAGKGELDARDERFLKDVAADPEIMRTGHKTDPEGFKLWLLERGHDLLAGTAAARPTWEVE